MNSAPADGGATRHVVLVAGYDFRKFATTFDAIALNRVFALVEAGATKHYALRFHFFSVGTGVVARSVILPKAYPLAELTKANPRDLRVGAFWQSVAQRFGPVTKNHYSKKAANGDPVFNNNADAKRKPNQKVMSIVDIYRFLSGLAREDAKGKQASPPRRERLLELSFFSHAHGDGPQLVNSTLAIQEIKKKKVENEEEDDNERKPIKRNPLDKDGHYQDFRLSHEEKTNNPDDGKQESRFWQNIAAISEPKEGRGWLWGGRSRLAWKLLEAIVHHKAYTDRSAFMRIPDYHSRVAPSERLADDEVIIPTTSVLHRELATFLELKRERALKPFTFGQLKQMMFDSNRQSYAQELAATLRVIAYSPLAGMEAFIEEAGSGGTKGSRYPLMRVLSAASCGGCSEGRRFDAYRDFYQVHLGMTTEAERHYGVFPPSGVRERKSLGAASGPWQPLGLSPLAGLWIFREYEVSLKPNSKLQTALEKAIKEVRTDTKTPAVAAKALESASFSIAELGPPGVHFPYAGIKDTEMYWPASVLKIAALFAAYRLRVVVRAAALKLKASSKEALVLDLERELDPLLEASVSFLGKPVRFGRKLSRDMCVPQYRKVFDLSGTEAGDTEVEFTSEFRAQLASMIVHSDNTAAAYCIQALGYSFINGIFEHAGGSKRNVPGASGRLGDIWLAGDFLKGQDPKVSYPYVEVPSVNDGLVAQAAVPFQLTALLAFIATESDMGDPDATEMMSLLHNATRDYLYTNTTNMSFSVEASKVGYGERKDGHVISAELFLARHRNTGRKFAVFWQNLVERDKTVPTVSKVVDKTISGYAK